MLEHRIAQLEERLLSARVITKKEISKDSVSVGSTVRLRDIAAKKTFEYHIVGSAEANPAENKLSNESPVGKAIWHEEGRHRRGGGPARRAEVQDPRDQSGIGFDLGPDRADLAARAEVAADVRVAPVGDGRAGERAHWRGEHHARAAGVPVFPGLAAGWCSNADRRAAPLPWLFRDRTSR